MNLQVFLKENPVIPSFLAAIIIMFAWVMPNVAPILPLLLHSWFIVITINAGRKLFLKSDSFTKRGLLIGFAISVIINVIALALRLNGQGIDTVFPPLQAFIISIFAYNGIQSIMSVLFFLLCWS